MIYKSRKALYRNTIFRSSLEAEWAAFFDTHNISWQYEPQSFTDGKTWYLPDFYLKNCYLRDINDGVWLEIKPAQKINGINVLENYKHKFSVIPSSLNFCVFFGHPIVQNQSDVHEGYQISPWWDNYMTFQKCKSCGNIKIEFDEGNYMHCPKCHAPTQTIVGYR